MASFKAKDRKCSECGHVRKGHEEKETDVNIAVAMLNGAYHNEYDHAYLVSRDSDPGNRHGRRGESRGVQTA